MRTFRIMICLVAWVALQSSLPTAVGQEESESDLRVSTAIGLGLSGVQTQVDIQLINELVDGIRNEKLDSQISPSGKSKSRSFRHRLSSCEDHNYLRPGFRR